MPTATTPFTLPNILLMAWIPVSLWMAAMMSPRRGVIVGYILGWLLLPNSHINIPGMNFLAYDKQIATSLGVLLGSMLLDPARVWKFRLSWWDLPMLVWWVAPLGCGIMGSVSFVEAVEEVIKHFISWGIPYVLGRVYIDDLAAGRDLALGIAIGGLAYMPLCVWEVRMSPWLHRGLYGFFAHETGLAQGIRFGGWRPIVFLQHGLALGMYMAMATMMVVWLWATRTARRVLRLPMWFWSLAMVVTMILVRSTGALALLLIAGSALAALRWFGSRGLIAALTAVAPLYIALRATGLWTGTWLVEQAENWIDHERASSLQYRLDNENAFVAHAMQQPIFGWGPGVRQLVLDEHGDMSATPDGMWTLAISGTGLVGLSGFVFCFIAPVWAMLLRFTRREWAHPAFAGAAALAVLSVAYGIDNLMNAMENPIFFLAMGGVSGIAARRWKERDAGDAQSTDAGFAAIAQTDAIADAAPAAGD